MNVQNTSKPARLAIIATHPIQHFVPFYRELAQAPELDMRVFFMSDFSVRGYFDDLMKTHIAWEMDMLSGYDHTFLPESGKISQSTPLKLNNPSIGPALDEFNPDVVLAYGYNQVTQWRVLRWCRRQNVPLMMISDSELLHQRGSWRKAAKNAILPRLFRRYSAFLTTGDNNENYLRAYGVPTEKVFRSPFTIDEKMYLTARAERASARARFRSANGIESDAFVALTVGKLSPGKRPMDVLDAALALPNKDSRQGRAVQFLMAGDGALKAELAERIAAENIPVKMLGFVNVDKLADIYCAADVLMHLSEVDAHPLALSEAACIGLPLIVSDRVGAIGPGDIARAGENTIVTPCGDAIAVSRAVAALAKDDDLYRHMSDASIRIYDELNMARSVEGLLDAVCYCQSGKQIRHVKAPAK